MKINHFGVNQSPNKRPIPRDVPHTHSRTDLKYRIHKYWGNWFLCDTNPPMAGKPWRWPQSPQGDYMTSEGRWCRNLHTPDEPHFDTFAEAHAAYLSQIS